MASRFWRLKRSLNNLAFRMSIVKLTPGTSRPLLPLAMILIVGFSMFVVTGGLFVLVQPYTPTVQRPRGGLEFVYPQDIHNQTVQEFVFAFIIYSIGILGLYLMLSSTRYAYRPARAWGMLAFSMILIVLFIGLGYFVLYDKIH